MESSTNLVSTVIEDPFERLVIQVSSCMISEPSYYKSAEDRVVKILASLKEVSALEPSFVAKLAYYARNELNLRSTPNFIAAWAVTQESCRASLTEFFPFIINLPSDLLDFVERYQALKGKTSEGKPSKGKPTFSTYLQSLIKRKFCDFSVYQLGKYCSEGKRKRLSRKAMEIEAFGIIEDKKPTMKSLVRACHIKRPAMVVASIVGKRYPSTPEDFAASSFSAEGDFQPELAGKRLKIPTPVTWETTLSEQGNKAECWEGLISSNKLPFMAMLRNIRNLLATGVDGTTHQKVCDNLKNPDIIQNSRLFPFRFLSAYESLNVNLEEMKKLKENPNEIPSISESNSEDSDDSGRAGRAGGRPLRGDRIPGQRYFKAKAKKIPKVLPTPEVIEEYKAALEEAIKLATALNVSPLRGHTAIFCDASGSMDCDISSGPFGSVRTCMDLGFLFGMMMRHVCETSDIYVFSSSLSGAGWGYGGSDSEENESGSDDSGWELSKAQLKEMRKKVETDKCWRKADLQGDNVFELIKQMHEIKDTLGGGTEYPFDWFETAIMEKRWYDNFILFSDMIISTNCNDMFGRNSNAETCHDVLRRYRESVNPDLKYITVDLAGNAREMAGANLEDRGKNLVIGGYSDAILKLINSMDKKQSDIVRACKPARRNHNL